MNLMSLPHQLILSYLIAVNLLTPSHARSIEIPPCPEGTERSFYPSNKRPLWASCKDPSGLYQGLLIQFSSQSEIIRVAAVKDSLRNGREIRFGDPGTLEERTFKDGQLEGPGYLFLSDAPLGRHFPKSASSGDWSRFVTPSAGSILKDWLGKEPRSEFNFQAGRLNELKFGSKKYRFRIGQEGRIYALNHPEMNGGFFVDPEAFWDLSPNDLRSTLNPGFGSCKKYSGPIGRFVRHYDTLLFRKMPTEKKHLARLSEIRNRFIEFCIPKDLIENLGKMECPPQLPSTFPPNFCLVSLSDRIRIPYDPKFFKFDFSLGHSPEEIALSLRKAGIGKFLSSMEETEKILALPDGASIQLKKTPEGMKFKFLEKNDSSKSKDSWWEWHRIPGL
ncbi:MAG: hypothetical protein KGP28_01280 [Bdellovibrionales bacterium]|nr:hypothetical protein [Bdellovibrionales bacterium]